MKPARIATSSIAALILSTFACLESLPEPAACAPRALNPFCAAQDSECPTKTADQCFPAPDCPPAIRSAQGGARCVAVESVDKTVGCATCAVLCDGRGPVLGPDSTLTLKPAEEITGHAGIMVRARGVGTLTMRVAVTTPNNTSITGPQSTTLELDPTRTELVDLVSGPLDLKNRIDRIMLTTSGQARIEIDCVVPYVLAQ